MKAILETATSNRVNCDIDLAESPIGILRRLFDENETMAGQFFANERAIADLKNGEVDEHQSTFEIMSLSADSIRADWKKPLCEQPEIKEEIAQIEAEGQTPVFVVCVASIVA